MRALVHGKFLPYHSGHAHLIHSARAHCDDLTVLVCSIKAEPVSGHGREDDKRAPLPDSRPLM